MYSITLEETDRAMAKTQTQGFFEDSASEDGEQASATPSPAVTKLSLMSVNA